MSVEKIAFVYPTLILEGMAAGIIYQPNIFMRPNRKDKDQVIAVTVGMMFNDIGMYFTEVDILHDGESVLSERKTDGRLDVPFAESVADGQQLHIYSLFSNSVSLKKNGVYHVVVKFYHSNGEDKYGDSISEGECFFYVSHDEDIAQ